MLNSIAGATSRIRLLNIRPLASRRVRTAVSTGAVAVSALLIVAIISTYGSVSHSVEQLTNDISGATELEVTGVSDNGFNAELLPKIAAVSGVSVAAPLVRRSVQIRGAKTLLVGVDQAITRIQSPLGAEWRDEIGSRRVDPTGVVAGPRVGVREGDPVPVGALNTHVSLVIDDRTANNINLGHFLIAPLPLAQAALDRPGRLDSVLVVIAKGHTFEQVRAAVDEAVKGRAMVTTPLFRSAQTSSSTRFARDSTLLVAGMSLVVAAFIVFNTMSMTVAERRREVAILRAIGATPGLLARDLIGEAALMGALGGALGVPLGVLFGRWTIGRLPPLLTDSFDANVQFFLPPLAAPLAVLLCLVGCSAAAAVTALSVLRIPPIEAIGPVGTSGLEVQSRRGQQVTSAAAALFLIAAAVVIFAVDGAGKLVGAALFLVGAVLVSYVLMGGLSALTAGVARLLGSAGRLGATAVRRSPTRTWITAMTVGVAVAIGITTSGAVANLVTTTDRLFAPLGDADFYVSVSPPDVTPTAPVLPLGLADKIRTIPGVESVVPMQFSYSNFGGKRLVVNAVSAGSVTPFFHEINGNAREQLLSGRGVLVSRQMAKQFGLKAGERFDLQTPSGPHSVQILDEVNYLTFDAGIVVMSLDRLQQWFERPGATYLELRFAPQANKSAVRDMVRRAIPTTLHAYTGEEEVRALRGTVVQVGALAVGVQWVIAGVSAIALLNIYMLAVLQRRRELAMQRAMGASSGLVGRAILAEATAAGVVGAVIGIAVGALAQYIGTSALSATTAFAVHYQFLSSSLLYGVVALVVCVAGVIPPVIRATRTNIVTSLSTE